MQSEHQMGSWEDIKNLQWMQEHGDTVFDGRTVNTAVDPDTTDDLSCNVMDEQWLPDLDDGRPETMTIAERIKELYDRLKFLEGLADYQENPDPNMAWKYENRGEYEDICREQYQDVMKRLESDPENQALAQFANTIRQRLVLFRTYDFLASDPEARRNEIEYEVRALMASRDARFKEAFWRVNEEEVKEQANILLDKIPVEQFDRLAQLAEQKEEPDQEFVDLARDLVVGALGLDDLEIKVQFYVDKNNPDDCGSYSKNEDGSFTVYRNKVLEDYDETGDSFIEYAGTVAHEIRHIKQDMIMDNEPESELGKMYRYCDEYYVDCDLDYDKYTLQLVEAEAFSFGEGFRERLRDAWVRLKFAERKKTAQLGSKLIEMAEVDNG